MLVEDCIDEVLPKVEEESELKCDIIGLKISLFNFKDYDEEKNKIKNYARYFINEFFYYPSKELKIKEFLLGNMDYLKIGIGHELMHNAQHNNFPTLFNKSYKIQDLDYLIEGDATLIENFLTEKYYPNPKSKGALFVDVLDRLFFSNEEDYYGVGERILKEKFNNGKNRKGINRLYKKSIKDILKIFEIENH